MCGASFGRGVSEVVSELRGIRNPELWERARERELLYFPTLFNRPLLKAMFNSVSFDAIFLFYHLHTYTYTYMCIFNCVYMLIFFLFLFFI